MRPMNMARRKRSWRFEATFAAMVVCAADAAAQTVPSGEPGWRFSVTPYGWLPTVDGSFRYGRAGGASGASTDVNVDPAKLLDALNFAAMIAAEARYGRFSISAAASSSVPAARASRGRPRAALGTRAAGRV
jgi:hypothetical protein